MKSLLIVLLVCVASSYAVQEQFGQLINNVQTAIQAALGQLVNQLQGSLGGLLGALLGGGGRFDLNVILSQVTQLIQGLGGDLVQQIMGVLGSQVIQILNPLLGAPRSTAVIVKETQAKILDALSGLASTLQGLLSQLVGNLIGTALGGLGGGKLDLSNILSLLGINVNDIMGQLQGNVMNVIANLLASINNNQRGFLDFIVQTLGIQGIMQTVQQIGGSLLQQFNNILTQLIFAGQAMWQQAIPVFQNLASELTNHAGNAVQLVSQAVLQLTAVLAQGPQ